MTHPMAQTKAKPSVRHASRAKFVKRGLRSYFAYRDLGVRRASGGRAHAHVIKALAGKAPHGDWHYHDCKTQFVYVLKGWVKMQYEGGKPIVMKAGSCFFQPSRIRHRELAHSRDLEMIEVVVPGRFRTYAAE